MPGYRRSHSSIRSAVDLVTIIQEEKMQNNVTMAVLLDRKGAHDNIKHAAISREITKLGLSERLCTWVPKFLQDRTIYISTEEEDTPRHILHGAVSQDAVLRYIPFEHRQ